MTQWWLNHRWASQAYSETLAKIDVAVLLFGATILIVFALRG